MKFLTFAVGAMSVLAFSTSCKKEDPIIPNEEELITTVIYTLISQDNQDTVIFEFYDLDGPGGNPPSISNGILKANTLYNGEVVLLNEQEIPAENITEEVQNEGDEHQFFYTPEVVLNGVFNYADTDINGNPIGITSSLQTGNASEGNFTLTLRHEPNKLGQGVKDGDITNAGGETDVEVIFNAKIQ